MKNNPKETTNLATTVSDLCQPVFETPLNPVPPRSNLYSNDGLFDAVAFSNAASSTSGFKGRFCTDARKLQKKGFIAPSFFGPQTERGVTLCFPFSRAKRTRINKTAPWAVFRDSVSLRTRLRFVLCRSPGRAASLLITMPLRSNLSWNDGLADAFAFETKTPHLRPLGSKAGEVLKAT